MKSNRSNNFAFLMPDGTQPNNSSKDELNSDIKSLIATPKNLSKSFLSQFDSDAWIKASAELEISGFRKNKFDLTPIAYTELTIRGVDEDKDLVTGLGILTQEFMSLHWNHRLEKRGMKVLHKDITGVQVTSLLSAAFNYKNIVHLSQGQYVNLKELTFEVEILNSRDKHQNRRALTFWLSLNHYLIKKLPELEFWNLD